MSFVQLFPAHMLSLESILGFCHEIAKGGDCKVEFYQPYDSRATQILKLGVSEFCSTVPNSYVKSRICFKVLSQNSQRRRL